MRQPAVGRLSAIDSDHDLLVRISKRLVSYCDPISVGPGDEVRFMVSSHDDDPFDAQLVRIVCGDVTPAGHGYTDEECDARVNGRYDGRHRPIARGSFGIVPPNPALAELGALSVEVAVYPTLHGGVRTLMSSWGSGGGFAQELRDEVPQLVISDGSGGSVELCAEYPLALHRWTKVAGTYDPAAVEIGLTIESLVVAPGDVVTARPWAGARTIGTSATVATDGPLLFAAREIDGVRDQHFDGRLDACALGFRPDAPLEARWDFSLDIGTDRISDTRPHGLRGTVRQLPMRGIPGANWTGEVHDWTVDLTHYGAIHFHADDLADAEWEPACTFTIPDELASGVYALRRSARRQRGPRRVLRADFTGWSPRRCRLVGADDDVPRLRQHQVGGQPGCGVRQLGSDRGRQRPVPRRAS